MAWLVWKNVLKDGQYTNIMRKMLPAPCMRRGYEIAIENFSSASPFSIIFQAAFPQAIFSIDQVASAEAEFSSCRREHISGSRVELNKITCMWYYLLKEIDPSFWTTCVQLWQRTHDNHTDTEPILVPLYKIYRRLILVLVENFGIPLNNLGVRILEEIENGPEREAKRQKKREERNLRRMRLFIL